MASNTMTHIDYTTFAPNTDCGYSKPRINKVGGKSVGIISTKDKKQLKISTPVMLTWGVNERENEQTGRKTFDMSLQFPNDDYKTPEAEVFLQKMVDFQEKIKNDAVENAKEWFNKSKMTKDQVDVLFHPMLAYPKDKESGEVDENRAPTLKVKLEYWDEKFKCELYDMKYEPLFNPKQENEFEPNEIITKLSNLKCVIKCGGIWFANGKFGVTWNLEQACVKPKEDLSGRCFLKLTDEEKLRIGETNTKVEETEEKVGLELTEDSDDETETQQETETSEEKPHAEEEEEPKKKKVQRKKK